MRNGVACLPEQIKAEHPTKWELVQNDQLLVRVAASDPRLLLATACGGGGGGSSNPPSPDEPANPARTPFAAAVATSAIVEAAVPAALAKTIARSRHLLLLSSIEARHCARSCLSQLSVTPRASIETTHAAVRPFHLQDWIKYKRSRVICATTAHENPAQRFLRGSGEGGEWCGELRLSPKAHTPHRPLNNPHMHTRNGKTRTRTRAHAACLTAHGLPARHLGITARDVQACAPSF